MTESAFATTLVGRFRDLGLDVPDGRVQQLTHYFDLLRKWSSRVNLTGFDLDALPAQAIDRLFVEPIVASFELMGTTSLVDVGSGAGSPAIPMALMLEGVELMMLEPRLKKSIFLREAVRELGIRGSVLSTRVEETVGDPRMLERFDSASIRAVRLGKPILECVARLVRIDGQVLLFSGQSSMLEQATMPPTLTYAGTVPLIRAQGSELFVLRKVAP